MDPPKPFPILRLPFLAIEEVFKAMVPFEIINFSMISKRTKSVTQQMNFYSKYSIRINASEKLEMWVVGLKYMTACCYVFTSKKEMNGKVVENTGNGWNRLSVWKYSDNLIEEWQQLCKHALEIFKKQTIDLFSIALDAFVDYNVSIIDFLKTNVKSVGVCYLLQSEEENDVDKHAAYFLNNLTVNNELHSNLHIKNYHFDGKIPKNLKELNIHNSIWIGYERLLEIDCRSVILGKNLISIKEWNLFLKKWIAMETNENLEYLEIDYREIEEFRALVLHDISHEVVDEDVKKTINGYLNSHIEINGWIDIRRIDGKTATFFVSREFGRNCFAMSVH